MAEEQLVTHEMNPETGKLEEVPVDSKPKKGRQGKKKKETAPEVQAVIEMRRDIVASLAARGMRQTEITKQLSMPTIRRGNEELPNPSYLINPETGQPFDKATINRDIKALRAEWQKSAKVSADEYFGEQLAEIREVRRRMWAKNNEEGVLRSIALEIKLTGSARPEKKEIELGEQTRKLFTKDELEDLTDEQLAAIAAGRAGGGS